MGFRRIFDAIPEEFDKWRPRYCAQVFEDIARSAELRPGRSALEIGPGTGQATEPILRTGCDYLGVELGEHLAALAREKFRGYSNFRLVCADFLEHDFGGERFDLILSAATIQWLEEEDAFPRCYDLLKPGSVLAMMWVTDDYRTPNPALYDRIQAVYAQHFRPTIPYTRRFCYENAVNYGFAPVERQEYVTQRVLTAEEYVAYCGTHCDHMTIEEPHRTLFFEGLRRAVEEAGGRIVMLERVVLLLARKEGAA